MQWFKHHSNFRNSPAMKHIAGIYGDKGVAAVYRLYEVCAERFGIDNDFSGSILLSPPTSEHWLLSEVLLDDWMQDSFDYDNEPCTEMDSPTIKNLMEFLCECENAGIVRLEKTEDYVWKNIDGVSTKTDEKKVWTRVIIPGFAELSDVWTARKKSTKALETTR